jgi:uncharacterized membrane protein
MHKKSTLQNFLVFLIALAPLAYLAISWSQIPGRIPMHYNIHMEPDRMGNKSELWISSGFLAGVSLLVFLLLKNINRIDPKRIADSSTASFARLGLVLTCFLAALNFLIIFSSSTHIHILPRLLLPVLGLLFAFIGNYFHSLKPNYFAGFRLPWTLSSESNWKKTHLLAGKLWFWGGLFLALATLFLPPMGGFILLMAGVFIMVVIPVVYSFRIFRAERDENLNRQNSAK